MAFNWLYTSWNDNEYILFLVIIILTFIIINFGLWKRKKDNFYNITQPQPTITQPQPTITQPQPTFTQPQPTFTQPQTTITQPQPTITQPQPTFTQPQPTITQPQPTFTQPQPTFTQPQPTFTQPQPTFTQPQPTFTQPQPTFTQPQPTFTQPQPTFTQSLETISLGITTPETTLYQSPTETNPSNNIFISDEEKEKWRKAAFQLDGNDETLPYNSKSVIQNDILQVDSTLYNEIASNSSSVIKSINYDKLGNYATVDNLGKSLTDTLGGINSNLGYTLLEEQLGTFKPNYNNPNTYDNTQSYKTDLNPNTVDGVSLLGNGQSYKLGGKNGTPIIMQKDFAGVANIFAPNIYISNPPLNSDGYPDISYSV
jgi:hypothetical protein